MNPSEVEQIPWLSHEPTRQDGRQKLSGKPVQLCTCDGRQPGLANSAHLLRRVGLAWPLATAVGMFFT